MRNYMFAAILLFSFFGKDFKRCVRLYVTNNGVIEKNVVVNINGREFVTDERGMTYVDLGPGRYTVCVYKDSCEQIDQEIVIDESMVSTELKIYCPK
jgi:hypothetical protein